LGPDGQAFEAPAPGSVPKAVFGAAPGERREGALQGQTIEGWDSEIMVQGCNGFVQNQLDIEGLSRTIQWLSND